MKTIRVAFFQTYNSLKNGNKGISILTILMLILVSLNLLMMPALIEGMKSTLLTTLRESEIGDISVRPERGESMIQNIEQVMDEIMLIKNVVDVTPKTISNSLIESDEGILIESMIQGIQVQSHKNVFNLSDTMIEGEFLEPGDTRMVVMGIQVAGVENQNLELYSSSLRSVHAGDYVEININGKVEAFKVKGIYQSNFVLSDQAVLIPEEELYEFNPMLMGNARSLHLKINDLENTDQVLADTQRLFPELISESWETQAGMVETMAQSLEMISGILTMIALIVAAITILIVTYVDITNKKRQVGIQRAIGINNSSIVLSYVFRAVVFALIGTTLGFLTFRFVLVPVTEQNPIRLPSGYVSLAVHPQYTLNIMIILIMVTIIAATIPTINAVRIKIIDAIWGN